MNVESGRRDKFVTIEQASTDAAAGSGFPRTVWTTLGREWMSRRDASGTERLAAAQLSAAVGAEWEMPYWESMDPDLVDVPKARRLRYLGRIHDIQAAHVRETHEGRNIRLITLAQTRVAS